VHAFAVRTDDDMIVVDSGLGDAAPHDWEMSSSRFPDELVSAGVEPTDVGLVVLTHLHVDHVGGVLDAEGAPRFPNARHVVHEADLDAFENAGSADRDPAHRATTALRGAGLLDPGTDDAEVAPGVTVRHAPGHTPGHRVVELGSSATLAVLCGDAVVHPVQVEEPARRETFDADPGLGARTRAALIERVAGTGAVLVPAHTARSFGRVSRTAGSRFRWVDVA
jgi:glyoxylase-like metal-dependent hydrolase (beta-lactamase superfamily II)